MVSLDHFQSPTTYGTAPGSLYVHQPLLNSGVAAETAPFESGEARVLSTSPDLIARQQEKIEKKLSCRFYWYMAVTVTCQSANTFFVLFHLFDSKGSEKTLRYAIGYVLYMIFFFLQSAILLATFVSAFVIYYRLTSFLKPESPPAAALEGVEEGSEDDAFVDQSKTPFEQKRSVIRNSYKPKYLGLNLAFAYLLVILTLRVGIYIGLRLTSTEKMFQWTLIRPVAFYLTYTTDLFIMTGVIYFVGKTTPLKSAENDKKEA